MYDILQVDTTVYIYYTYLTFAAIARISISMQSLATPRLCFETEIRRL
jgi:hypothetical protein